MSVVSWVLPVDAELRDRMAGLLASLPTLVTSDRAEEIDAMLVLARDEMVGRHVAGVDDVFAWQEFAVGQAVLDRGENVRRVGTLAPVRFDKAVLLETIKHGLEEAQFSLTEQQPRPELDQH